MRNLSQSDLDVCMVKFQSPPPPFTHAHTSPTQPPMIQNGRKCSVTFLPEMDIIAGYLSTLLQVQVDLTKDGKYCSQYYVKNRSLFGFSNSALRVSRRKLYIFTIVWKDGYGCKCCRSYNNENVPISSISTQYSVKLHTDSILPRLLCTHTPCTHVHFLPL